jgi:hypothetical protein
MAALPRHLLPWSFPLLCLATVLALFVLHKATQIADRLCLHVFPGWHVVHEVHHAFLLVLVTSQDVWAQHLVPADASPHVSASS